MIPLCMGGALPSSGAEALVSEDRLHVLLDRDPAVCRPILTAADEAVASMLQAFRTGPKTSDATGAVFMRAFISDLQHSAHGPYPIKQLEDPPYPPPVFHSFPVKVSKTSPTQILAMGTFYDADAYHTDAYLLKPGDPLTIIEGHPSPFVVTSNPDPSTVERQVHLLLDNDRTAQSVKRHDFTPYLPLYDPSSGKTKAQYMATMGDHDAAFYGPTIIVPVEDRDKTLLLVWTNLPNQGLIEPFQEAGLLVIRLTPSGYDKVCWLHSNLQRK